MTANDLVRMTPEELGDYVWRRLRLESPLNPPLSDRMGPEPPEEFIIAAVRAAQDHQEFVRRLHAVTSDHLKRLKAKYQSIGRDPVATEQLISLAFLAEQTSAQPLAEELYDCMIGFWFRHLNGDDTILMVLQALADAVVTLAPTLAAGVFWAGMVDKARDAGLRATAFDALVDTDLDAAMTRLPAMVDDPDADVGLIAWNLATTVPGARRLGELMRERLNSGQQEAVLDALRASGADDDLIATIRIGMIRKPGFPFPVNSNNKPKAPHIARPPLRRAA